MLKKVDIRFLKNVEEVGLKDPVFIEGLPGIGHVGKLVADHLVRELNAEKIIEIYSHYFPPQVIVKEDGKLDCQEMKYTLINPTLYLQIC